MSRYQNAGKYLQLYNRYNEINKELTALQEEQLKVHKELCVAAGEFLEINEEELSRILFYFDSIALDAVKVVEDGNP